MRPLPPAEVLGGLEDEPFTIFLPAPELEEWARAAFLTEGGPFYDDRNSHLEGARIAWLWASATTRLRGQTVIGTAELAAPPPSLSGWRKARYEYQFREWFGPDPYDFLITLAAPAIIAADDASFCAITLHELCHCGQALDDFGNPRFHRDTGLPVYRLVGHDVEEHVMVVEWFGIGAAAGKAREFVKAAGRAPRAGHASISGACGTCLARAA